MDISTIAKQLAKQKPYDSLRDKPRVEIPAAIVLSTTNKTVIKQQCKIILEAQQPDGWWYEYSYEKNEESEGYYGAIPTSFCILALNKAYELTLNKTYLNAAIKGCDYLYRYEKSGYFVKAQMNKTNVLNTNLICGAALLQVSNSLHKDSRRKPLFKFACVRAVRQTLASQLVNGAYPYTAFGLTVPLLYHAMTLSLLSHLNATFKDDHVSYSVIKGTQYLTKHTDKRGNIMWSKEKFSDKTGAVWAYAWSHVAMHNMCSHKADEAYERILMEHTSNNMFATDISSNGADPFYTAWCFVALHFKLTICYEPKKTLQGLFRYYFSKVFLLLRLFPLVSKIFQRKLFSYKLDKGPVEYW